MGGSVGAGQWAAPQSPPTISALARRRRPQSSRRSARTRSPHQQFAAPKQPGPQRPLPARGLQPANSFQRPASATPMCQVEFEMACAAIKQLKGPVSDREKLLVYSFYKQATQGDCNIPAPPATDVKAKAKWEAWNENRGMSKMDAMRIYVAKVEELKKNDTG
ncbi:diazepam-binding inhibitor-like 5 [Ursus maritimus]|uniref:Diazepam-binding inhibitor-like 5 n=3 Tax=Ursus TaxID=9639 RepID=A0A384CGC1_URSMA|nr:diazepam-binding inhibitor-like 5 [Ursus maritimus]